MTAPEGAQMTLIEHLTELRTRLFVCIGAVAVGGVVMFVVFPEILEFLAQPYRDITAGKGKPPCPADGCDLIATDPLAPFMVRVKVAVYGGLALALPVVMWQIWRFVVPALHAKEKRYAIPFIVCAIALFLAGAALAWYTIDKALGFLLFDSVGGEIQPFVTADKYLTLVVLMVLAFGIAFEFPLLLVFLLLAGAISTETLRRHRRWAAVGITTVAAIITPTADPISLLFLAVPLYLFYESSILIGRVMHK
ncbi:MAG: twin-arginine translocase subunit TatC [Actinomycetota bacterium]